MAFRIAAQQPQVAASKRTKPVKRPSNFIDLTGKIFGKWTVVGYAGKQRWNCRCRCGVVKEVSGQSLRVGDTKGCLSCRKPPRTTHGKRRTRLYGIWCGMKQRCFLETSPAYDRYGGRGITVHEEWRDSFEAFHEWAGKTGYSRELSLDRIDNDGNYEPDNCRWATSKEQARNTRRNRPLVFQGETLLVVDLEERFGLPQDILKNRIFRYGWSVEEAVSTPVLKNGQRRPSRAKRH